MYLIYLLLPILIADFVQMMDPSINTIPYLYTLRAYITSSSAKQSTGQQSKQFIVNTLLWQKAVWFLEKFDPIQIRYSGNEFVLLVEDIARVAEISDQVRRQKHVLFMWMLNSTQTKAAIRPIRTAILRLDPSASCFTSSHLVFVRLCLRARTFRAAKSILDKDIYELPSSGKRQTHLLCSQQESSSFFITTEPGPSRKLEYQDHLKYFLYGAMIYMSLKEWERALLFLEITLTWPTANTSSMVQVHAYRRWVLVNLLLHGSVVSTKLRLFIGNIVVCVSRPWSDLFNV